MEDKYFKSYCEENGINIKRLNDKNIKRLKDTVGFNFYVCKKEFEKQVENTYKRILEIEKVIKGDIE